MLGVISTALYLNRARIRQYFNGDPEPTPEIGEGKTVMEIMDKESFGELDAEQDRRPNMHHVIIDGVRVLRGSGGGQKEPAELEVKRLVAELEVGESSTAVIAVKKSAESLGSKKDEKDEPRRSNSSHAGDVEIEVVRMGSRDGNGSAGQEGGYF